MTDERPWWASGGDGSVDPGPAAGDDPSSPGGARPAGGGSNGGSRNGHQGAPGTEDGWAADDLGREAHAQAHDGDVCRACPICTFLRVVGDARPEVVSHLMEAGRHLTLAAKAAVDAQATRFDGTGGFQRIDLDDD